MSSVSRLAERTHTQLSEEYVWLLVPKTQLQLMDAAPTTPSVLKHLTGTEQRVSTAGTRGKIVTKTVKVACVHCRAAAKRCDVGRPCVRCIKYGLQDTCVDASRKRRKNAGIGGSVRGVEVNPTDEQHLGADLTVAGTSLGPSSPTNPGDVVMQLDPRGDIGIPAPVMAGSSGMPAVQQGPAVLGQTDPLQDAGCWATYSAAYGTMPVHHNPNEMGYSQAGNDVDNATWYYHR